MSKKNLFQIIVEISDKDGFFKKDDLRKKFPERSNLSINQSIFYNKKKGLIKKAGKKFQIINQLKKPENMENKQLVLTSKEHKFFNHLIDIDKHIANLNGTEDRVNEGAILSLIKKKGCDESVWENLKVKLVEVGIITKCFKGGKNGDIFSIDQDKLIDYLDSQNNLIRITPFSEDVTDKVKEIISSYRDKNKEILSLEKAISETKAEMEEIRKKERRLQKELEKLNMKYRTFPDLEKIRSLSPVIESIDQLPKKDLILFLKVIFEE